MFKTKEYIEKFAKLLTDQMEMENYTKEQVCIAIEEVLKDFQKDLLESASKGKEEAWVNYRKGEGHYFGHKEALEYGWQACALSYEKKIDYKDNQLKLANTRIEEKGIEIDRLNKEIRELKNINQSEALLNTSLHRKNKELTEKLNSAWGS